MLQIGIYVRYLLKWEIHISLHVYNVFLLHSSYTYN